MSPDVKKPSSKGVSIFQSVLTMLAATIGSGT